jgi:hypothetical protein
MFYWSETAVLEEGTSNYTKRKEEKGIGEKA